MVFREEKKKKKKVKTPLEIITRNHTNKQYIQIYHKHLNMKT